MILRRRAAAMLGTMAVTAGLSVATATPASAAGFTEGPVTVNCSWGSCSYYLSRSGTRKLNQALELLGGAEKGGTAICTSIGLGSGGTAAAPCFVILAAVAGGGEVTKKLVADAVNDHPPNGACLKITKAHVPAGLVYPSTNNGKYCKD
jgi:hypothetical protein